MIDVGDAFDPEFLEPVRRRRPSGSWADGYWTTSGYADATIQASVQPATLSQTQQVAEMLPEGERGGGQTVAVYTRDDIRAGDGTTTNGDVIEHGGSSYRVVAMQKWPSYKCGLAVEFTP